VTKHVQVSSRSTTGASGSGNQRESSEDSGYPEGVEDEDYELQAALQASLTSREGYGSSYYDDMIGSSADSSSQTYPNVASRSALGDANSRPFRQYHGDDSVDPDPVAASTERNRVLLRRMREQQELAQRELWSVNPEQQDERRQARLRREEEEEAEQLRKAIAESEDMARQWDERQKSSSQPTQIPSFQSASRNDDTSMPAAENSLSAYQNYDDEDAELQAALRASLENVPSGRHQQPLQSRLPEPTAQRTPVISSQRTSKGMDVDEDEIETWPSQFSDSSGNIGSSSRHLSLDEIRQARLARFGS